MISSTETKEITVRVLTHRSMAPPQPDYALALFAVRRGFGCGALAFAQCSFLVLFSLILFASCPCRPLSVSPIFSVIGLESRWDPLRAAG
jgi:hypothetical protein